MLTWALEGKFPETGAAGFTYSPMQLQLPDLHSIPYFLKMSYLKINMRDGDI